MGTPIQGYDDEGSLIWQREIDSYGNAKMQVGEAGFCNYLYQGQTLDTETGLAYNRFRYYAPEEGMYISQYPIRLFSNEDNFYSYVVDPNTWIDEFGLAAANDGTAPKHGGVGHNGVIDDEIHNLKNDPDVTNIRKNQQQVDVNGNKAGTNRPDIQYDKDGVHHNVEFDTSDVGSMKHQNQIPGNDPNARNTFWLIDENGNPRQDRNGNGSCSKI